MVIRILESKLHHEDPQWLAPCIAEADDGEMAVQMVATEMQSNGRGFDFILMDNVMLRMNGPEAARIIRQDLKYSGIILGITGNVHAEQIADFVNHGVNEVITKPLTKSKLLLAIATY
mmetsp:Transcript_15599/g.21391  ORF Transcript_15599/g.21391 Transcript_15599/m.21391 type:complete len:118 (-) Transcript_15599:237-590(-)